MKISKLFQWCSENFVVFVVVGCIAFFITVVALVINTDSKTHALFPEGTEVIVKGTNIHGTVIRWGGDNVVIGYAEKNGEVKTVVYNYNLLKKQ